jgi:hypothetical protein
MKEFLIVLAFIFSYFLVGGLFFSLFSYWGNRIDRRVRSYRFDDDEFLSAITIMGWPIVIPARCCILAGSAAAAKGYESEIRSEERREKLERENRELQREVERLLAS